MQEGSFRGAVQTLLDVPWPPVTDGQPLRLRDERDLAAMALALGAPSVGEISPQEADLLVDLPNIDSVTVRELRSRIASGDDPLGTAFCRIRSPERRREDGAIYTPPAIVRSMLAWAETVGTPSRVLDPGAGSGRFLLEAGQRFPAARLVAVEPDPLAALTVRANLAASGMADRAEVRVEDFRTSPLNGWDGTTLFVGNPPYVRHHLIERQWKAWLKAQASVLGFAASALAGLHVYFFLAVAAGARPGDYGAMITAAEWLDVNYGQLVRELFLGRLGGQGVTLVEPKAQPFPGTQATGAITTFVVNGRRPAARFRRVTSLGKLGALSKGRNVQRARLQAETRWSRFTRARKPIPEGFTELGELCRVHRGQVTGANRVWIAGDHSEGLPTEVLFPTVTRAAELFSAGWQLTDPQNLRHVIDLPANLDRFRGAAREAIDAFLAHAEALGVRDGYTARHRPTWWSIRLRPAAPILATYMARRPPAFVLNRAEARHLNIAHGLYPRETMSDDLLQLLVQFLRRSATLDGGREYAGGLTKFEPREMERIPIPEPSLLHEFAE